MAKKYDRSAFRRGLIGMAGIALHAKKYNDIERFFKICEETTMYVFSITEKRLPEAAIAELFDKYITPEEIAARIILMLEND